ncbi:hypothetical protein [Streptomyces sp. YIM 98790]|uniref:hypothetical protein n=1 Tax=Streptomyces sp. YIM 98790 TaxID=2689077 RepID=UPI00140D51AE|nr:hypothetical protein [Streptomyces sp. YIM 98790]
MGNVLLAAAGLGAAAQLGRILLFWLMARERTRMVSGTLRHGRAAVVVEHDGPGRARLEVRRGGDRRDA